MSNFIHITEVGPRDGFQNIKTFIPTETKLEIIDQLVSSGIKRIEITSMVSPKAIPQMVDAKDVIAHVLTKYKDITPFVLVPNSKGAQFAYEQGIRHINYVISVSPEHNKANINRTHQESINDLQHIVTSFPDLNVVVTLATAFGCPFIGEVNQLDMFKLIDVAQQLSINNITLCDTIGVANPMQTQRILEAVQHKFPHLALGLHMHNTHGMALANMLVGLQQGVTHFETAIGGLGGCPFAPGAAGNLATEDAINMLARMGYTTGISLVKLLDVVKIIQAQIEPNLLSSLSRARAYQEFNFFSDLSPSHPKGDRI